MHKDDGYSSFPPRDTPPHPILALDATPQLV